MLLATLEPLGGAADTRRRASEPQWPQRCTTQPQGDQRWPLQAERVRCAPSTTAHGARRHLSRCAPGCLVGAAAAGAVAPGRRLRGAGVPLVSAIPGGPGDGRCGLLRAPLPHCCCCETEEKKLAKLKKPRRQEKKMARINHQVATNIPVTVEEFET